MFLFFSESGMKAASREAALFHDVPYVEALGVHQERPSTDLPRPSTVCRDPLPICRDPLPICRPSTDLPRPSTDILPVHVAPDHDVLPHTARRGIVQLPDSPLSSQTRRRIRTHVWTQRSFTALYSGPRSNPRPK